MARVELQDQEHKPTSARRRRVWKGRAIGASRIGLWLALVVGLTLAPLEWVRAICAGGALALAYLAGWLDGRRDLALDLVIPGYDSGATGWPLSRGTSPEGDEPSDA